MRREARASRVCLSSWGKRRSSRRRRVRRAGAITSCRRHRVPSPAPGRPRSGRQRHGDVGPTWRSRPALPRVLATATALESSMSGRSSAIMDLTAGRPCWPSMKIWSGVVRNSPHIQGLGTGRLEKKENGKRLILPAWLHETARFQAPRVSHAFHSGGVATGMGATQHHGGRISRRPAMSEPQ